MEDREIIQKVKAGDIDVFRHLVERYQLPLLRFIYGIIRDQGVAEDIGQAVFLAFFKKLDRFDEHQDSPVSTWLFVAAKNLAINEIKRRKRLVYLKDDDAAFARSVGESAEESYSKKEESKALQQSLQLLEEPYRSILLGKLRGDSLDDMAMKFSTRKGTVKSRLHRGKQKLVSIYLSFIDEVKND